MSSTRLQKIIDLAKSSIDDTIEIEVYVPADSCRGIIDFSMYNLQTHKLAEIQPPGDVVGGVPIEWLLAS